jgi:uncharacterized Zn finger protein
MSDVCANCPMCGSTDVRSTLRTLSGSYCRCAACGHAWHDDHSRDRVVNRFYEEPSPPSD